MTTILIAEDQVMMRTALTTLLDLEDDMSVVAGVGRGDEIIPTALETLPDVALLDIELPGRSGLDVISELAVAVPDCRIIVVTTFGRSGYLKRALESGARGFLVKDDPVEELAQSIRQVLAGDIVVNPKLAAQALSSGSNPLTERETDVLSASANGQTIADIASALFLSPSTVRNYLSAAIGKTTARNRAEALSIARDRGWL